MTADDIVIIASISYPEIAEQLTSLGIKKYFYYEELAYLIEGMKTYYPAFENVFGDLEDNKSEYVRIYDLLEDDLSKSIYADIILYKATLDVKYTMDAFEKSHREGIQDFDKIITARLDKEYTFYDVGGFDGGSTLDFIHSVGAYDKIYFFEPDREILEGARERLKNFTDIVYMQAGVGEEREYKSYSIKGGGGGFISEYEEEKGGQVKMVVLDDFVRSSKAYIKMDIEGYELPALMGARKAIISYKPMLSVSVYHRAGDLHNIIPLILSWNPEYKVYLRHYTKAYADTRAYFIPTGTENKQAKIFPDRGQSIESRRSV